MKQVVLRWEKVFSIHDFDANIGWLQEKGGIYLWILKFTSLADGREKREVCYVGETSDRFSSRFEDHFSNQVSGKYVSFDIHSVVEKGGLREFFETYWKDKSVEEIKAEGKILWPCFKDSNCGDRFRLNFLDTSRRKIHDDFMLSCDYAFAKVADDGSMSQKEIESALIFGLRNLYGNCRKRSENGDRTRHDIPIGQVSKHPTVDEFVIVHDGPVAGQLPAEFLRIDRYKQNCGS